MRKASVSDLKARLSGYLRVVRSGGEVLVTDRGLPAARLVPTPPVERGQAELVEAGLVQPASRRLPNSFWKRLPLPELGGAGVLDALLAERDSKR